MIVCLAILGPATPAEAKVRLPRIFGDNMVLQRDRAVPIWGWADAGENVVVQFGEQTKKAVAGDDGKWRVDLEAMPANAEPRDLLVGDSTQATRLTLHHVLVGEVWLCSGRSNMEWGVGLQPNGKAIIEAADHPSVRLFVVPHSFSYTPQDDLLATGPDFQPDERIRGLQPLQKEREKNAGVWYPCTPANIDRVGWKGFSCAAYFFAVELQAKLHVPVGLIQASFGGSNLNSFVPLEGFQLVPARKATADTFEQFVKTHPKIEPWYPTVKYNAMIRPLVPFAIRGVLWHQGETDVGGGPPNSLPYFEGMKALIGGWRKVGGQGDFPFYYVMTGPYRDWKDDELPRHWMSQLAALSIPHTGFVVTTDCGEPWDLHAHNKDLVGRRLALWALAKTYGLKEIVYSGPLYKGMKIEGSAIRVAFDSVGGGLASRDGADLTHFEIAGADGRFVPAVAKIQDSTVVVSSEKVKEPTAVRFAWTWEHSKPPAPVVSPNFMNKEGLPAAPFNTTFVK